MTTSDNFQLPEEMYRNNRPEDPDFDAEEVLYFRFANLIDGEISLPSIKFPNQSVNRSKYSEPEWVLYSNYPSVVHWGIASFRVREIPERLESNGGIKWEFIPKHVPEEENYSHSEIKPLRNGEEMRHPKNKLIKAKYKIYIRKCAKVLKKPD